MASLKPFFPRNPYLPHRLAYAATVVLFLWVCTQFYITGKGFTYLIRFGTQHNVPAVIPALGPGAINHFEEEDSYGYDAQYYAQIAMRPWLGNPALKRAVDSLPYRARRILFAWTAYGLALGDPSRALQIYAVQNIVCWLALAVLMLRWFPPVNWGNFARWFGVLFSSGLCLSVRGSLVDGPSLLLIAAAVALAETGRTWWSAAMMGVAGLGRETNILAAGAPAWPSAPTVKAWAAFVLRGALAILPLALWLAVLRWWVGSDGMNAGNNFAWPFHAYYTKWANTIRQLKSEGIGSVAQWSVLMLVALTAQWLFLVLRPRWQEPWWRVGAAYAMLMAALGDAVWEGYPGAASRVLLPMVLAFNILVPRGRRWWLLLLLGNLTVVFSSDFLKPPGREDYHVSGSRELYMIVKTGHTVEAIFNDKEWFLPERSRFAYWRWSRGNASLTLHNPQDFPVMADISFDLKSNDERHVTVSAGDRVLWSGDTVRTLRRVKVPNVRLDPGDTVWRLETDQEAEFPSNGDLRKVAFSLRNLEIRVTRRAETPAAPVVKP